MRASSTGLEADVYLSEEELKKLSKHKIEGHLRFFEVNGDGLKREIPFSVKLDRNQREFLKVSLIPDGVYFGDAERIEYTINGDFYEQLVRTYSGSDRYWSSGKLNVSRKN